MTTPASGPYFGNAFVRKLPYPLVAVFLFAVHLGSVKLGFFFPMEARWGRRCGWRLP